MIHSAKILIHKASMPIARLAVRTFSLCHPGIFRELEIHSDGSLGEEERYELLAMEAGMPFRFVEPEQRREKIDLLCADFPKTHAFLDGRGYRSKMEIPAVASEPYFYFDSDVVWLRRCGGLVGEGNHNLFSTESWTWYPGIRKEPEWVKAGIPRRVNSGFYFLKDPFPFALMERLLEEGLYDPCAPWATDQEIMAFLYPNMRLYHPDDLMRSRRGILYDPSTLGAGAIHFPGRMWEPHLRQLERWLPSREEFPLRILRSVPLDPVEILRMKISLALAVAPWARMPSELYRKFRAWRNITR